MTFEKRGVIINNNFYSYEDIASMCNYYETGDIKTFLSSIRQEGYEDGRKIRESGEDKMKHFLYRIYDRDNEDEIEIIVYSNSQDEADARLSRDDTISHFSYLCELSEEEAKNSGLDEI